MSKPKYPNPIKLYFTRATVDSAIFEVDCSLSKLSPYLSSWIAGCTICRDGIVDLYRLDLVFGIPTPTHLRSTLKLRVSIGSVQPNTDCWRVVTSCSRFVSFTFVAASGDESLPTDIRVTTSVHKALRRLNSIWHCTELYLTIEEL